MKAYLILTNNILCKNSIQFIDVYSERFAVDYENFLPTLVGYLQTDAIVSIAKSPETNLFSLLFCLLCLCLFIIMTRYLNPVVQAVRFGH